MLASPRNIAKTSFRWLGLLLFAVVCSGMVAILVLAVAPRLPQQGSPNFGEPSDELIARLEELRDGERESNCPLCTSMAARTLAKPPTGLDWQSLTHLAQWLLAQPPHAPGDTSEIRFARALRLYSVGAALQALDSIDDAQRTLKGALDICQAERRVPTFDDPDPDRFDDLAGGAAAHLGVLYARTGKWTPAERAFRAAIDAEERLLERQRDNDVHRSALAAAWAALGDLYFSGDRPTDGKKAYERAEPLLLALAARHPGALECHTMLAGITNGRSQLADTPELAESLLDESITRLQIVAKRFADHATPRLLLVQQSSARLGLFLGAQRYADAAASAANCVALATDAYARFPTPAMKDQYRLTLRRALLIYALCPSEEFRDPTRALETARCLAELAPSSSFGPTAMALAYNAGGDWQAAIEAAARANQQHRDPANLFCLAIAYSHTGEPKLARRAYDSAVTLMDDVDDELALDVYRLQRREATRVLQIEG